MRQPFIRRVAAVSICVGMVVVGELVPPASAARPTSYEVCHRTNAISDPYRRITVAWNGINDDGNFHDGAVGHEGRVFDVADPVATHGTDPTNRATNPTGGQKYQWGDIFYADRSTGGSNSNNWFVDTDNDLEWDSSGPNAETTALAAGRDIFAGATFTYAGVTKRVCRKMTIREFMDAEIAAGRTMTQVMADLDAQSAAEDAATRTALGGSFASWHSARCAAPATAATCNDPATLEAAISELVPSTSTDAVVQSGSTATLKGIGNARGETTDFGFYYSSDCTKVLSLDTVITTTEVVTALAQSGTSDVALSHELTSLPVGTYCYRSFGVSITGSGDDAVASYVFGLVVTFTVAPPTAAGGTESSTAEVSDGATDDPREQLDDPFVNISADPTTDGTQTGGTLEIDGDPSMELLSLTASDPSLSLDVTKSGVAYNKPETWVQEGFGDECWKFEPGGSSYVLPAVPQTPSGTPGTYSLVKVKAGSITSTDPNFQVNTVFVNPRGGDLVWPDSNGNGVYDPGGRFGDKDISHVIVCVRRNSSSTTTVSPGGSGTTSSTVSGASTSSSSSSSSSSTPTSSSSSSSSLSSSSSSTAGGATTSSSVQANGSSTTAAGSSTSGATRRGNSSTTTTLPIDAKDNDGRRDNIIIDIEKPRRITDSDKPVVLEMKLSTGFKESIVKLTVDLRSMTVRKVEAKAVGSKKATVVTRSVLPATGSRTAPLTTWVVFLLLLGAVVRLSGRWVARR